MQLLVRNRVKSFDAWLEVCRADQSRHEVAGMTLQAMWRAADDPNNVFFLFDVEDRARAEAFMAAPESAEAGRVSGVIDGEAHFVNATDELF